MAVYIRHKKVSVNEDDASQQEQNSAQNAEAAKMRENINAQIVKEETNKRTEKTNYENRVREIDKRIIALKQQLAQLGGDVKPSEASESVVSFGRRLFEAITNKTDEMYALITMSFDSMESLSYTPSDTRCRTFAKNMVAYINRRESGDGISENDFRDFVFNLLNKSQISLSSREKESFLNKLAENMKNSVLFSWVINVH